MNYSPVLNTLRDMIKGFLVALPNIVVALLVFAALSLVARGIRRLVERLTVKRKRARNLGLALGRLAQGAIVLLGLFVALLIPALVSKPSSFAMPFLQGAVAVEL